MTEIVQGLFLGGITDVRTDEKLNVLYDMGVRSILTVCSEVKPLQSSLFNYKQIDIEDDPREEVYDYFQEVCDWISDSLKLGSVFIHCQMGVSRSATFVCAYLMQKNYWSRDEALSFMLKKTFVRPNSGFMKQLLDFDKNTLFSNF